MLTAACYWSSSHCILSSVPAALSQNRPVVGLRQGCVLSPLLFIVYVKWMDSHSHVDEGITAGGCIIKPFASSDVLVLLVSSQQGLVLDLIGFQLRATEPE